MLNRQNVKMNPLSRKLQNGAVVMVGLAVYLAIGIWGGVPPQSNLGFFLAGLIVMMLVIVALGLAGWHLLFRPLPTDTPAAVAPAIPLGIRHLVATLLAISGLLFVVSLFWDEVWHRLYGIPFGEDLFWRPHLMLYVCLLIIIGLSAASLWHILRMGEGTLQQRFRANPLMGLLVLAGTFLLYVLPTDPLWHYLYGADIAAWSIPHINLFFSFTSIMVLALLIHVTTQPIRPWDMRLPAIWHAWLPIFSAALVLLALLQVMTTDWENARVTLLQTRPAWLLPATIVSIAALTGSLVSHATRFVGAGILAGLLALGIRLFLHESFDFYAMTANAWVLVLFPLIAMDIARFAHLLWRKRPSAWPVTGLAATMGMALAFPLLNQYVRYPQIDGSNLLSMLLAVGIAACGAAWVGQRLGDYAATANKQEQEGPETAESTLRYVPVATFLAVIGFIVFFIVTATPPV